MSLLVDVHSHVFPPEIAPAVRRNLEENLGLTAHLDGTLEDLVASLEEHDVDRSVALGAAPEPRQVDGINEFLDEVERQTDGRVVPFYTVHPHYEGMAEELERLKKKGAKGIKVHSLFQGIDPSDSSMNPIYEVCGDELAVLIHGGPPATPDAFARVLDRFPDLKLIAAHYGGIKDDEPGVREHLLGEDLYFDMSLPPSMARLGKRTVESVVREHGADRVLFGSDSPMADVGEELAFVRSLDLPGDDLDRLLGENARDLIGLDV